MKIRNFMDIWLRFWAVMGRVSVRTKIFGIVFSITLLLSMTSIYQVRSNVKDELVQQFREEGISIARDVAARAVDLILINDLYSLHELLLETKDNFPDVRYVFILDADGEILVHTFGEGFPLDLLDANQVNADGFQNTVIIDATDELAWDVAVPIFDGRAGTARVGISNQQVLNIINGLTSKMALTLVAILTFSLIVASFLTLVLTRPIKDLVAATSKITLGDFSPRLSKWAEDEFGTLAVSFNQMAEELSRMEEIRKDREELRGYLLEGVITAQEEERKRISRELHDSTSQNLSSIKIGLHTLELSCKCPDTAEKYEDIRDVVFRTIEEVRQLALQLRPMDLDDLGLVAALDRLFTDWENRTQIKTDHTIILENHRLDQSIETTIYRIVQEGLTNVERHSGAKAVSVLVKRRKEGIVVVIEDNGKGFDDSNLGQKTSLGLLGMKERTELLGGTFTIETSLGQGVSLFISIPDQIAVEGLYK